MKYKLRPKRNLSKSTRKITKNKTKVTNKRKFKKDAKISKKPIRNKIYKSSKRNTNTCTIKITLGKRKYKKAASRIRKKIINNQHTYKSSKRKTDNCNKKITKKKSKVMNKSNIKIVSRISKKNIKNNLAFKSSKRIASKCIRKIINKTATKKTKSKRVLSSICKKTIRKKKLYKFTRIRPKGPRKGPRTAYIFFFKKFYKEELNKGKISNIRKFGRHAGESWRNMELDEKNRYLEKAKQDRLRYNTCVNTYI